MYWGLTNTLDLNAPINGLTAAEIFPTVLLGSRPLTLFVKACRSLLGTTYKSLAYFFKVEGLPPCDSCLVKLPISLCLPVLNKVLTPSLNSFGDITTSFLLILAASALLILLPNFSAKVSKDIWACLAFSISDTSCLYPLSKLSATSWVVP